MTMQLGEDDGKPFGEEALLAQMQGVTAAPFICWLTALRMRRTQLLAGVWIAVKKNVAIACGKPQQQRDAE